MLDLLKAIEDAIKALDHLSRKDTIRVTRSEDMITDLIIVHEKLSKRKK